MREAAWNFHGAATGTHAALFKRAPLRASRRFGLATGIASLALLAAGAWPVGAQIVPPAPPCDTVVGTTVTCTGDVSPGVSTSNPFTVLNVNGLTADMAPASGDDGINFTSSGDVAINTDTGAFQIRTTGNNAETIFAQTASGEVSVTSIADLSTTGNNAEGIWARATSSGAVTVASTGNITTQGNGADAISAQSVDAQVTVSSTGDIATSGNSADGILAVNTTTGNVSVTSEGTIVVQGDGINARTATGSISVANSGAITTSAGNGEAIDAQSASGGVSVTSTGNLATMGNSAEAIWARATSSGAVTVTSTGNITTQGTGADAINAQSVNAQVTVTSIGDITASGNSGGIIARNTTTGNVTVTSEGSIAVQGDGINARTATGILSVTSTGAITTSANNGEAIEAQSTSGAITVTSTGDLATMGNNADAIWARATSSGAVTVTSTGNITTQGTGADAIDAQSVNAQVTVTSIGDITASGNSGGILARNTSTGNVTVTSAGTIAVQGDGINARTATGSLSVASTGAITTSGNNGEAIEVQSASGAITVTSTGNIATMGTDAEGIWARATSSGPVSITSTGNITTQGSGADAIEARADGGTVEVASAGDISASGSGASGIRVQSSDGATVTILSGTVSGGTGGGAGVDFVSNSTNVVWNYGALTALSGTAINGSSGNETIQNYGTITGNVTLGTGNNALFNNAGASLNTGATVNLRAGSTLTNAGALSPGGAGMVQTTALTGNLVQTAAGVLVVDINSGSGDADRINISGTAVLNGAVGINFLAVPAALTQEFTILSAAGGATDNGLTLFTGVALGASLAFVNGTDVVVLDTNIDFAQSNRNQNAIGEYFNAALVAGTGGLSPVLMALLSIPDLDVYHVALDQLLPELYADAQIAALYSSLAFADNLLSCKVNGPDTASIIREGQCLWAGASARFLDRGATYQQISYTETAGQFAAGAQVALDPVWRVGFGLGYQSSTMETGTSASMDGEQVQAGVALKYNPGPFLLAGVVSGGHAWYDATRPMAFGGFTATAGAEPELDILNGAVRGAYVFGSPHLYFKPMVDAASTRLDLGGFSETGGGAANLAIASSTQTVYTIAPALEMGTEWWMANGTLVRPYLRGGATWFAGGAPALSASFLSAPAGVTPFTILTNMDDVMGVVGTGIEVINGEDAALRLSYEGELGATTQIHSVGLKGSARF